MSDGLFEFVGGPSDGVRRALANPPSVMVMPIVQPVQIVRKVVPFNRGLDMPTAFYRRFGHVYWWEGLLDDAWCEMVVSDQFLAEGGSTVRRLIRDEMRDHLAGLAPDKEVGRIIWRIKPDGPTGRHTFRALVGPHAVERGLYERETRQSTVQPT